MDFFLFLESLFKFAGVQIENSNELLGTLTALLRPDIMEEMNENDLMISERTGGCPC